MTWMIWMICMIWMACIKMYVMSDINVVYVVYIKYAMYVVYVRHLMYATYVPHCSRSIHWHSGSSTHPRIVYLWVRWCSPYHLCSHLPTYLPVQGSLSTYQPIYLLNLSHLSCLDSLCKSKLLSKLSTLSLPTESIELLVPVPNLILKHVASFIFFFS